MTSLVDAERSALVLRRYRSHISSGRASLGEVMGAMIEVSSSGAWVELADGGLLLDCGGFGVFLLGHRHPRVVEAVVAQVRRHPLATRLLLEERVAEAAEALSAVAPAGLRRVYFVGGGAEAVETAIKLARAGGCARMVATHGGYHGKTMGALSLTGRRLYQEPFEPLVPGVEHVAFGDTAALAAALATGPRAAVFVEPVQAEGGVILPPPGYLADVARLVRQHGGLLVVDEIQTGMGRLGRWWGVDDDGVTPDILLAGKTLSGGVVPVAAVVATEAAFAPLDLDPFLHSATFAGSPIACSAVVATIQAIRDEGLVERSAALGAWLLGEIERALAPIRGDLVADVRGRGLLLGIEMADPELAGELFLKLLDERLLANHSLNSHTTIRLTPPAVMSDAEAELVVAAVRRAGERLSMEALSYR